MRPTRLPVVSPHPRALRFVVHDGWQPRGRVVTAGQVLACMRRVYGGIPDFPEHLPVHRRPGFGDFLAWLTLPDDGSRRSTRITTGTSRWREIPHPHGPPALRHGRVRGWFEPARPCIPAPWVAR
jgi:hypothetical protein